MKTPNTLNEIQVFPSISTAKKVIATILKHRDTGLPIESFREFTDDFNVIMRFLVAVKQYVDKHPLGLYPNITSLIYQDRLSVNAVTSKDISRVYFTARTLEWNLSGITKSVYFCTENELHACNSIDLSDARLLRWQISNGFGIFKETCYSEEALAAAFLGLVYKLYQEENVSHEGVYQST